jgi:hypothetical protein
MLTNIVVKSLLCFCYKLSMIHAIINVHPFVSNLSEQY